MYKFLFELTWWAVTAVIVAAVMYPIWVNVTDFPVWWQNILFIVVFITLTRYIFLLKYTFLARIQWLKILLVLVAAPSIFALLQIYDDFKLDLDSIGPDYVTSGVAPERIIEMATYIKNEFFFFAIGSLIASVTFVLRMIISVWRVKNRGTV